MGGGRTQAAPTPTLQWCCRGGDHPPGQRGTAPVCGLRCDGHVGPSYRTAIWDHARCPPSSVICFANATFPLRGERSAGAGSHKPPLWIFRLFCTWKNTIQSQVQAELPPQKITHQPGHRYTPFGGSVFDRLSVLCGNRDREGVIIFLTVLINRLLRCRHASYLQINKISIKQPIGIIVECAIINI